MSVLEDAIRDDLARNLRVVERPTYMQVFLPFPLTDSSPVTFYVTDEGDTARISDRGLVADSLLLAGVDITAQSVQPSVAAILRATGYHDSMAREDYELAVLVEKSEVVAALRQLTSAALRVDSLRPQKSRPKAFRERVQAVFRDLSLPIVPNADLDIGGGHTRRVTLAVESAVRGQQLVYVQALGSSDHAAAYDRARSMFGDAPIDRTRKVAVLQGGISRWEDQPLENLEKVARVEGDDDLDKLALALAR